VIELVDRLASPDSEIVTLLVGEGVDQRVVTSVEHQLEEHYPQLTVEIHHGDQPLYPFLVGVE